MKIKSIKRETYSGQVFNVGVPENHTYFAQNVLVHNCYKGSTQNGSHADTSKLTNIIRALGKMHVFEVALGGGEPTMHPDFAKILRECHEVGIVPNFTTRSTAWMNDPIILNAVLQYVGGIAFSYHSRSQLFDALTKARAVGFSNDRINVHIVMGTLSEYDFESVMETIRIFGVRPVLLGYKTTERGATYKPTPYPWWIDQVVKSKVSVNIDTALASEYEEALRQVKVPSWMFHTVEGAWSMYIDAVKNTAAPSSYTQDEIDPIYREGENYLWEGELYDRLTEIFRSFTV